MGRAAFSKSWIEQWPTDTAAKNVLNKLLFRQLCDRDGITFRIETRRLVVLENITVKIIRARSGNKCHRRSAAPAKLGSEIRGDYLKLLHRIRVRAQRS